MIMYLMNPSTMSRIWLKVNFLNGVMLEISLLLDWQLNQD